VVVTSKLREGYKVTRKANVRKIIGSELGAGAIDYYGHHASGIGITSHLRASDEKGLRKTINNSRVSRLL
jgi:hypothetical protein